MVAYPFFIERSVSGPSQRDTSTMEASDVERGLPCHRAPVEDVLAQVRSQGVGKVAVSGC